MRRQKKSKPLYVFLHIAKNAGTTFNKHIEKNFPPDTRILMTYKAIGLPNDTRDHAMLLKAAKKYLKSLGSEKLERVKIIYGQIVPYGIESLFEKEVRYFTFFRQPAKRVVSSYNYLMTVYNREDTKGKRKDYYKNGLLLKSQAPIFSRWFLSKWDSNRFGFETSSQYKILQALGYLDKGKVTRKKVEKLLNKFYFVGLTRLFPRGSLYMYNKLSMRKFFIRRNVSKKYYKYGRLEDLERLVRKKVANDYLIYELVRARRMKLADKRSFKNIVSSMKLKRQFLILVTQLFFDVHYNLGRISSKLRIYLPKHGEVLDLLKNKQWDI